jgi:hypothetical protein
MPFEHDEFDSDKSIEPGQLDVECVRQPELFFKWAERSIGVRAEVDRLKLEMETTEAKLALEARSFPSEYGITKVSEHAISAGVTASEKFQTAAKAHLAAKYEAALYDSAVAAMEQKKRMLEVLVTLHGQEYFAGPSVPRNLVEAWNAHQEQIGMGATDRQLRRVRRRE